jgi:hypothetical protein
MKKHKRNLIGALILVVFYLFYLYSQVHSYLFDDGYTYFAYFLIAVVNGGVGYALYSVLKSEYQEYKYEETLERDRKIANKMLEEELAKKGGNK